MKLISTVFMLVHLVLASADALLADGSKIEANPGENVTLSFPMEKAEEADRLRIIFKDETTKNLTLIVQKCVPHEGCTVVDTPGVSVIFGKGCLSVILQKVDISRSGLYKAEVFFGKAVYEETNTLVVNKAPVSSTSPPHSSSSPTPPRSSDLHSLYALITAVIFIIIIFMFFCCFCRWRKAVKNVSHHQMTEPQKLQLSPDPVSQQNELENMIV